MKGKASLDSRHVHRPPSSVAPNTPNKAVKTHPPVRTATATPPHFNSNPQGPIATLDATPLDTMNMRLNTIDVDVEAGDAPDCDPTIDVDCDSDEDRGRRILHHIS